MRPDYFEYMRTMLKDRSGLVVTPEKMFLLEARLLPVARQYNCKSLEELIDLYRDQRDETVAIHIIEAMNTHESLFFRDEVPFDLFKSHIVPQLLKRRADKKTFRVWCAACSTGQEPYSLAMALDDMSAALLGWRTEIIATDISHTVLDRAAKGVFSQLEVQRGLPLPYLVKHITQDGDNWHLSADIRDSVHFQHFNLLDDAKALGAFDVVFCRNVLIYFDVPTKTSVLDNIAKVLVDDGALFLGSAESTMGITDKFWPIEAGRGVYKHTNGPASVVEEA